MSADLIQRTVELVTDLKFEVILNQDFFLESTLDQKILATTQLDRTLQLTVEI